MAERFHIDEHYQALIDRLVQEGRYSSASDVVADGLQLVAEREMLREAKLSALRAEIQKGIDSGPGREVDAEQWAKEIKARGMKRLAEAKNGR
jgi:antitoxin ParD1/3/4